MSGASDMQDKAAQGLNNILGMTEKKTDLASLKAQATAAGWYDQTEGTGYGTVPLTAFGQQGLDYYHQYAQKYPSLFVPKAKNVGVDVPKAYIKQLNKYQKIVDFADQTGQSGATIDRARTLLHMYQGLKTTRKQPHTAIQSGFEAQTWHTGEPMRFDTTTGERLPATTSAEKALLAKVAKQEYDSESGYMVSSATQAEKDQAAMIQAKKDKSVVQFTTEKDMRKTIKVPATEMTMNPDGTTPEFGANLGGEVKYIDAPNPDYGKEFVKYDETKDNITYASDPLTGVMGYGLTPYNIGPDGTSDANREAWAAEGGTNLISSFDAWLKQRYTDQGQKIPYWYDTRDRIEMTDVNNDGVPDMLSIVPYELDKEARLFPEGPIDVSISPDVPQFTPAEPYEVPYYVDIPAAEARLEAGETFESIMEKPPLSSDYMYWTDPNDNVEYVMSLDDHKQYLEAEARYKEQKKKVEKQQKYDEVFMDITRGRGPVVPSPVGKRRGASAGPAIQRVMSGTAPKEADIGGLVK